MISINECITKMITIEHYLLDLLEKENDEEERFQNLCNVFHDCGIAIDRYDLKMILYLIDKISKNHHRNAHFFDKLEKIILIFIKEIKNFYSHFEIYNIFKSNNRILLFLIEEKILILDENILNEISKKINLSKKYLNRYIYLFPNEALKFGLIPKIEDDFYINRRIGENHTFLCQIIQQDLIEDFITYVKRYDYSLKSEIESSIFETNSFLINLSQTSLIEYAAFYGSTQIFKYLYKNGVKLTPSIWIYAIHGYDAEIIQILEDKKIVPNDKSFKECFFESIKCHHFNLINYIESNFLKDKESQNFKNSLYSYSFRYYNFNYLQIDTCNDIIVYNACKFDYYKIVEEILKNKQINLNKAIKVLIVVCF